VARGREEVHVDARDLVAAELDPARAGAVAAGGLALPADPGDQLVSHHARRALGEHPGLGRAHARDVAHRVDPREASGQRPRIDGDPAALRQAGLLDDHLRPVHRDVSLVRAVIGHDAPGFRVDRGDGLLAEPDVGHREVAVGKANGLRRPLAEHDVQLREAEHEGVRAIDQGDADLVTRRARGAGRELEATEAGPEHEHGRGHGREG
jgi:hypothetical protein